MYKHLKVTITQDFYIPESDYIPSTNANDFEGEKKITAAIRNNINGWQWSGSKVKYETQGEVSASPTISGGTNIIYGEDLK